MYLFKKTFYFLFTFIFCFVFFHFELEALNLPPIPSQYVYDEANQLSAEQENQLNQELAQLEKRSTHQLVIAVVSSLQGTSIEDYSIQLAEKWKPGQKGKDNGVILLVAPNERKVRIEVGYGLESILTDALSAQIIQNEILPHFKKRKMDEGILQGTNAILQAISGEYMLRSSPSSPRRVNPIIAFIPLMLFPFLIIFILVRSRQDYTYNHHGWSSGSWSSGSSWSGGGGFSSGGGSFGGGGSSGSW